VYASTRGGQQIGSPQGSPELWPRLGGEEVRGPSSEAVFVGVADTVADSAAVSVGAAESAAVETLMAPPVPGVIYVLDVSHVKTFSRDIV
jgi:hypothetical protein